MWYFFMFILLFIKKNLKKKRLLKGCIHWNFYLSLIVQMGASLFFERLHCHYLVFLCLKWMNLSSTVLIQSFFFFFFQVL